MFMLLLRFIADKVRSGRVKLKRGKFKVGKSLQLKEQISTGINCSEKFKKGFDKRS